MLGTAILAMLLGTQLKVTAVLWTAIQPMWARAQIEFALLSSRWTGIVPMAPPPPDKDCTLVKAFRPVMDFGVGNAIGLGDEYGPWIVIGGLGLLAVGMMFFKVGRKIVVGIVVILGVLILLSLIYNNMDLLSLGGKSVGKTCN
ncbi:hypothetical protein EYC58_04835 [Candidatus Saccharibacteria bacterium]|nr:MAG: hypothetical protein EYC58_04835 [Candidatus Saccharibacteria bacterium]